MNTQLSNLDKDTRKTIQILGIEENLSPEEIDADGYDTLEKPSEDVDEVIKGAERNWVENPMIKLVFSIGLASIIGAIAFLFVNSTVSLPESQTDKENVSTTTGQDSPYKLNATADKNSNVTGTVKAQKATANLKQDIEKAQDVVVKKPQPKPVPVAAKKVTPSRPVSIPQPKPMVKPIPPKPRVPVSYRAKAVAPITMPRIPVTKVTPSLPVKPASVPKLSYVPKPPPKPVSPPPSLTTNPQQQIEAIAQMGEYRSNPSSKPVLKVETQEKTQSLAAKTPMEVASVLSVGTVVEADTVLPVIFGVPGAQKLLMQTTQPLDDLPEGTYILADVQHRSGAVRATVTGYIANDKVKPIPSEAILVLGDNSMPLMGVRHEADSGGFNLGSVILSGIGQGLERNNLPDIVSTISNGSSNVIQHSGDSDIVSGVLEGIVKQLGKQVQSGQSQAPQESFWYLPAQTKVRLFVQSPVTL